MLKKSRLYSIFFNKCPRCHEGDFFVHKNAFWPITKFDQMHKNCAHCGQPLTPEPGFYYGAMYMSYGFYVGVILITSVIAINWLEMDIPLLITCLIPLLIILTPVFFRMARRSWLTLFVPYAPGEKKAEANTPA